MGLSSALVALTRQPAHLSRVAHYLGGGGAGKVGGGGGGGLRAHLIAWVGVVRHRVQGLRERVEGAGAGGSGSSGAVPQVLSPSALPNTQHQAAPRPHRKDTPKHAAPQAHT